VDTEAITLTHEESETLLRAANLVTLARTAVMTDSRGEPIDAHAPEAPTRFAKQLTQIVRGGVAIGMERAKALQLAFRCARDSVPPLRLALLEDLAAHPGSTSSEARKRLQKPLTTVDRELRALHCIGLVECDEEPRTDKDRKQIGTVWRYRLPAEIDLNNSLPEIYIPPTPKKGSTSLLTFPERTTATTMGLHTFPETTATTAQRMTVVIAKGRAICESGKYWPKKAGNTVKIYSGSGTPIWVSPRENDDGVLIMQGRSHLMLSAEEIPDVVRAILEVSGLQT
jgi:hypothetical protein